MKGCRKTKRQTYTSFAITCPTPLNHGTRLRSIYNPSFPFWKWMKQSLQMTPSKNYLAVLWLAQHWQYWDLGSPPIRWPPTVDSTSKSPQQLSILNTRHKTKWEIFFKERLHPTVNGKCEKFLHPSPYPPILYLDRHFQLFEVKYLNLTLSKSESAYWGPVKSIMFLKLGFWIFA